MAIYNDESGNELPDVLIREIEERIINENINLPLLAKTFAKVIRIINNPHAEIQDFSNLIHQDQSLASHVLKVANSALYGASVQIISLQHAVSRLGTKIVAEIAYSLVLKKAFFNLPTFKREIELLWKLSLASGAFGKEIAKLKRQNVEGQYLCGLLHSIGKPVLLNIIADYQKKNKLLLPIESVLLILDRYQLSAGEVLIRGWKLPDKLHTACIYYLKYNEAPQFKQEAAITYLSDIMASWLIIPDFIDDDKLRTNPAFEFLNFYPEDIETIINKKDEVNRILAEMEI